MLTKEDKKEIRGIFCDAAEKVILPAVDKLLDSRFKDQEQKIDKKINKRFDDYKRYDLKNQDELMNELKTVREEEAANVISIGGINDRYMDHEKRITFLEESLA